MAMVTMERVGRLGVSLGAGAGWVDSLSLDVVFMAGIPRIGDRGSAGCREVAPRWQHGEG
jgi:hypothetical protein